MMARLSGKVALITGAGMGMGREASILFAEHGARIIVADINREAAYETVDLVKTVGRINPETCVISRSPSVLCGVGTRENRPS